MIKAFKFLDEVEEKFGNSLWSILYSTWVMGVIVELPIVNLYLGFPIKYRSVNLFPVN